MNDSSSHELTRSGPRARAAGLCLALLCVVSLALAQEPPAEPTPEPTAPSAPAAPIVELPPSQPPPVTPIECALLYETADGVYVDAGVLQGIADGQTGWILRGGIQTARFEVVKAARASTFLRILSDRGPLFPRAGERLSLLLDSAPVAPPAPEDPRAPSPTLKNGDPDAPFAPLLAPPGMGETGYTGGRNVAHGRINLRQHVQLAKNNDLDYWRTQLGGSGSVERPDGTPWALEWHANLSWRGGQALQDYESHDRRRFDLYRLAFFRRFDDRSFVRVGRFLPGELPSIGYLDGIQGEKAVMPRVRLGALFGLRPDREDLHPWWREPTIVTYLSYSAATDRSRYSLTTGVLGSSYRGKPDRLALLADQFLSHGDFSLYSSAEVDFDSGDDETRRGVELTRLDLSSTYRVSKGFRLRGGVDRFELTDTEAERDLVDQIVLIDSFFFDQGYWRYFVGAAHDLSERWMVDEEVSFTDSDKADDGVRYQLGLTRRGVFAASAASATLHVYRVLGNETDGHGARFSGFFPVGPRFALQPSLGVRFADYELESSQLWTADAGMRAHWTLARNWSLVGGFSYARTQDNDRLLVDIGVTLWW
ncbi:MAG: hypothetical protein ACKVX7_14625 [Planctomycetota bacterium]